MGNHSGRTPRHHLDDAVLSLFLIFFPIAGLLHRQHSLQTATNCCSLQPVIGQIVILADEGQYLTRWCCSQMMPARWRQG